MGILKAAIILGAGGYALKKFNQARERDRNCTCNREHNGEPGQLNERRGQWGCGRRGRDGNSQDPSASHENHGSWDQDVKGEKWTPTPPGTRLRAPSPTPVGQQVYRDEKPRLEYQGVEGVEKEGWVGSGYGSEKEFGGLRATGGA